MYNLHPVIAVQRSARGRIQKSGTKLGQALGDWRKKGSMYLHMSGAGCAKITGNKDGNRHRFK